MVQNKSPIIMPQNIVFGTWGVRIHFCVFHLADRVQCAVCLENARERETNEEDIDTLVN
jgi:hypothetical protein